MFGVKKNAELQSTGRRQVMQTVRDVQKRGWGKAEKSESH